MKCDDLLAALNEYVDGAMEPAICREFEQHMAGCNPCEVVVDNIRKTITLFKGGQPCDLPRAMGERLHGILRERWQERHAGRLCRQ